MGSLDSSLVCECKRVSEHTITTVCVDGLEKPQGDPDVHSDDVEVLRKEAIHERAEEGTGTKDEHFSRVSILCCEAERRRVLVVNFVNVLVQETRVEGSVRTPMEEVFKEEEKEDLGRHGLQ